MEVCGKLEGGVYGKDIILDLMNEYGVDLGRGYGVEFSGERIE
ncbi:aconitase family protein [Staphylococcus hominis]|nr:aconitase family protein [Staphylococcus hominis]